jgi:PAS domain S-box-containing protein
MSFPPRGNAPRHAQKAAPGCNRLLRYSCVPGLLLFVAVLLWPALRPVAVRAAEEPAPPKSITVVLDKDYPPYVISSPSGEIQGILVDYWKLWERQTGVPVKLAPMEWDAAQAAMRDGEADVIDMLFDNAARRKEYDFSKPYAVIDVPVFVHKDLGGIRDVTSLRGFPVAVKRGDASTDRLAQLGIGPLLYYDNYEDVIQAARDGKVKVFCVDAPPALYYLYKYGIDGDFRLAFTLYSGEFHRAVRKGDEALLRFVEDGFARIPAARFEAIEKKWRGEPLFHSQNMRYALWAIVVLAAAAAVLLSVNAILRRTVRRQTARLEDLLDAMGQSERRYRELVESAECIIVRLDLLGRVAFCNAFAERIFGLTQAQMIGRGIGALCDAPDDTANESWADILAAVGDIREGGYSLDRRHLCSGGRVIWIAWSLRALRDQQGLTREYLCVGDEITERKHAEEALATSEARYALAASASNDGIWDWDLRTNTVYYSPRYLEILGLAPDAVSPSANEWTTRIHPDDAENVIRENNRCARGETNSFVVEYRMRHEDGSYRWIIGRGANLRDEHGTVVRMAGSHTDITRRKKDEESLRESQDQLAKIFRLSPVGIAVSTRGNGRIMDVNENGARMFGYAKAEVVGRADTEIGLWLQQEDRRLLMDELAAKGSVLGRELELRHQNGSVVVVLYSAVSIQAYGESCFLSVLVDITERKAMEQALRRSKEAAEAANRAKSEFLSTMSHEIRTPMNTILGMSQILAATVLPPQQAQAIRAIETAGASLLELLNEILDLSQIEAGGLIIEEKPCDVVDLCSRIVDMLRPDATQKNIALRLEIFQELPPRLSISPERVRQVLVNLIGNAIKFTNQGEIVLEVGREDDAEGGPRLRLAVRDTGIGIPKDKLPTIFERFTQADASTSRLYGGVGLGLAISKKLVDMMGGHIHVETEEGQGSIFTVRLPLRPVAASDPAGAPRPSPYPSAGRRASVLLVEDSPGNAEVTRLMLQGTRFDLTWAPSGKAGLESFHAAPFDLVLMDMEMPEMDGFETTKALRRMEAELGRPRVPVIALTAHAFEEHRQRGLAAGCDDFQTKPIAKAKLLDTLEAWMAVAGR